ncbi:multiheme c-type cytochrome [soil metagenome]
MQGNAPMPWRPNNEVKGVRYVGRNTCAQCHSKLSAHQQNTAMANASERAADSQILRLHSQLTFRDGPYSYQIVRQGDRSTYTVTDGGNTLSEPILYSFGQGEAGQTYIFRHKGMLYESRVSFYKELQDLDLTIGHPRAVPLSLDEAAGQVLSAAAERNCFGCHTTAAVNGSKLQLDQLMPGVGCEACHGPGEKHVRAMTSGNFAEKYIFNPSSMSPNDLSQEFCGSCHRGVEDVMSLPGRGGISNVRFQPYRIFTSRGHDPNDPRLSCTACHNPHEPRQHKAAFYDAKCTVCHLVGTVRKAIAVVPAIKVAEADERNAKPCPVGTMLCVTCHMPKVELPGSHFKFTDHRIRIAKPNDPYPN